MCERSVCEKGICEKGLREGSSVRGVICHHICEKPNGLLAGNVCSDTKHVREPPSCGKFDGTIARGVYTHARKAVAIHMREKAVARGVHMRERQHMRERPWRYIRISWVKDANVLV